MPELGSEFQQSLDSIAENINDLPRIHRRGLKRKLQHVQTHLDDLGTTAQVRDELVELLEIVADRLDRVADLDERRARVFEKIGKKVAKMGEGGK